MLFMTIAVHLGIDPHLKYISEGKPTLSGFFYVGLVGLVGPTVPNTNPGSRLLSFAKCNWRRKNRVAQPVIDMRPMSQPHVACLHNFANFACGSGCRRRRSFCDNGYFRVLYLAVPVVRWRRLFRFRLVPDCLGWVSDSYFTFASASSEASGF